MGQVRESVETPHSGGGRDVDTPFHVGYSCLILVASREMETELKFPLP